MRTTERALPVVHAKQVLLIKNDEDAVSEKRCELVEGRCHASSCTSPEILLTD